MVIWGQRRNELGLELAHQLLPSTVPNNLAVLSRIGDYIERGHGISLVLSILGAVLWVVAVLPLPGHYSLLTVNKLLWLIIYLNMWYYFIRMTGTFSNLRYLKVAK